MAFHDMRKMFGVGADEITLKTIKRALQLTKGYGLYIIKNNHCIQSAIFEERQTGYDNATDQPKGICKD